MGLKRRGSGLWTRPSGEEATGLGTSQVSLHPEVGHRGHEGEVSYSPLLSCPYLSSSES